MSEGRRGSWADRARCRTAGTWDRPSPTRHRRSLGTAAPDAMPQEPMAGCITGPKKYPHTHITTILRKPCRFLTQTLPAPSLILTKVFPIPCTAKFSFYLGKYSDTLDCMTIVISHISAIEYWLAHESLKLKATSAHAATELPSAGPTIDDRRRAEQLLKQCASIPLHIATTKPLHSSTRFRCHVWSPPVARALYRIADDVYVCSPELAFVQSAAALDKIDTVRLGCELCATYSIDRHARRGFFQRNAITTREKTRRDRLRKPGGKRNQNRTMGARSRARPICVTCRDESCARPYPPLQNRRNGTPSAFAKPLHPAQRSRAKGAR